MGLYAHHNYPGITSTTYIAVQKVFFPPLLSIMLTKAAFIFLKNIYAKKQYDHYSFKYYFVF